MHSFKAQENFSWCYDASFVHYSYKVPVTVDTAPTNMYTNDQTASTGASGDRARYQDLEADGFRLGKEELNLLMAQLLGSQAQHKQGFGSKEVIRLSLFGAEEEKS